MCNNKQTKNSPPSSEFEHEDRCPSCGSPCNIHTDLDDKDYCNDCRIMTNNKAREYTSPLIEELLNEVTPEEMERTRIEMENMSREFDNTKLNYIANTLKETANRMEYIGDISDLGNEIGVTVGRAYENMTEENINDFISGFRHGISLTNGTH